jgi:minor extracellular serine protease Vpr
VAGVAALTRQAHPSWSQRALTAAVVQTADPALLSDYAPRSEGAGLVQPLGATQTHAVASAGDGRNGLSFGFEELFRDFHSSHELNVRNHGTSPIAFKVTATPTGGVPHTVTFNRTTIHVGPKDDSELKVRLEVPATTVGDASAFREVAGFVTLTPTDSSMNGGVSLHVPYYLVPRVRSDLDSFLTKRLSPSKPNSEVKIVNFGGAISGNADFYAWGLSGKPQGIQFFDTRAVGVQAIPVSATDSLLVFAINTFERFSSAAGGEFDIFIDTNGDGVADVDRVAIDLGLITAGSFNGQVAVVLFNLATGAGAINFLAEAPTDGSTLLLPVFASDLGVTPANPRFSYTEQTFNLLDGTSSKLPGSASFNAFSPAISNAMFVPVGRNKTTTVPVSINPAEWAKTPALGLMVVTEDNKAGREQAQLIEAGSR